MLSRRSLNFAGAIACALLLCYAYYLQYFAHLEPCPLCIFQRVAVLAIGVVFFIATVHNPSGGFAKVYAVLIAIAALIGIGIAGRHVYIQSLPPGSVPACGATLNFLLDVFPVTEVIRKVLTGSGECGKVDWRFLGMTMPMWVALACASLGTMGVVNNWKRKRTKPSFR